MTHPEPTPDSVERPAIYCTGGCDVCRDYARELGVPLIVIPPEDDMEAETAYAHGYGDGLIAATPQADRGDGLREALRAVLRDFDREPPEDYMPEAERIFRAALRDTASSGLDVERDALRLSEIIESCYEHGIDGMDAGRHAVDMLRDEGLFLARLREQRP